MRETDVGPKCAGRDQRMRNWPRGHKDLSVPAARAAQLVGAVALTLVASILQGKPKGLGRSPHQLGKEKSSCLPHPA